MLSGRVGKTSLLARFIHNNFKEDQQATIQAAFMSRQLQIDSHQVTIISILDLLYHQSRKLSYHLSSQLFVEHLPELHVPKDGYLIMKQNRHVHMYLLRCVRLKWLYGTLLARRGSIAWLPFTTGMLMLHSWYAHLMSA